MIEPERDILPTGGPIAGLEASGWGMGCICAEKASILLDASAGGPKIEPADKECWCRVVGTTGSDQDDCRGGKVDSAPATRGGDRSKTAVALGIKVGKLGGCCWFVELKGPCCENIDEGDGGRDD